MEAFHCLRPLAGFRSHRHPAWPKRETLPGDSQGKNKLKEGEREAECEKDVESYYMKEVIIANAIGALEVSVNTRVDHDS